MPEVHDFLMVLSVLAAVSAVVSLVLAVNELLQVFSQRYLAQLGLTESTAAAQGLGQRSAAISGAMSAFRKTVIAFLAAIAEKSAPKKFLASIERKLLKAGVPSGLKAPEIVAFQVVSGVFFLFTGLVVAVGFDLSFLFDEAGEISTGGTILSLLGALLGLYYPLLWLNDRVRERHHKIQRALPYNLDLLTLSVEAGLDFAAAIGKVVEKGRKGPLADELGITLRELKLGKTREEGLRNLGARVDLASLTTFVNALIQADKMGTPLGKILRIMSTQMRIERTQRAEKLANEAPVKMLGPLIGFIFPTIFIILFGPIFYQVFYGAN